MMQHIISRTPHPFVVRSFEGLNRCHFVLLWDFGVKTDNTVTCWGDNL